MNQKLNLWGKVEQRNAVLFHLPFLVVITTMCRGKGSCKSFMDRAFKIEILGFFLFEFVSREPWMKVEKGSGCTSSVNTTPLNLRLLFYFFFFSLNDKLAS